MAAPPRRTAWVVAPPEICFLCKEPLGDPNETSAWNGRPAHRECVRVHLLQQDPAFTDLPASGGPDDPDEGPETILTRDDDEGDFGG
ncbi:MAG: hypothetical protein ACYCPN_03315 [Thermoplasmata archaeon]